MKDKKDPLKNEFLRHSLALKGNLKQLRKTYGLKLKLPDSNPPEFWDRLLSRKISLEKQDAMTQDRIKIAFSFLPKEAEKVLDIGAGYGSIEELIQKGDRIISLYGIDISPLGIKQLKDKFKGKFRIGDIRKIPYPAGFFDAVFALEVLEHIPPSDTFLAFREIKRILIPNGTLIISVPTNEVVSNFSKNPSGHLRIYTPELIKAELFLAGFQFIKWKKLYAFNKYYWSKSTIAPFLFGKFQPNNVVIKARKPAKM